MALDLTIVQTDKSLEFDELSLVVGVVVEAFDWYLGNDNSKRRARYLELCDKMEHLTKKDVVDACEKENMRCAIESIPESRFNDYLRLMFGNISLHIDGNTHLSFDPFWLSVEELHSSCSWNLKNIFTAECSKLPSKFQSQLGDFVHELDQKKVVELAKRVRKLNIRLARWIGYFFPSASQRMVEHMSREIGIRGEWCDIDDIQFYRDSILAVAEKSNPDKKRLWMMASY